MFKAIDIVQIEARKGSSINQALLEAKKLAKFTGQVVSFEFNGVPFLVDNNADVAELTRIYNKRITKAA